MDGLLLSCDRNIWSPRRNSARWKPAKVGISYQDLSDSHFKLVTVKLLIYCLIMQCMSCTNIFRFTFHLIHLIRYVSLVVLWRWPFLPRVTLTIGIKYKSVNNWAVEFIINLFLQPLVLVCTLGIGNCCGILCRQTTPLFCLSFIPVINSPTTPGHLSSPPPRYLTRNL